MQSTALIMQTQRSVVVVGIRMGDRPTDVGVVVCRYGRRLIHIQRVIMEQWNDTHHLRDHEDRQQGCAKGSDCSHKGHGPRILSRPIVGQVGTFECGRHATVRSLFQTSISTRVSTNGSFGPPIEVP
jgi:hypothetical protein